MVTHIALCLVKPARLDRQECNPPPMQSASLPARAISPMARCLAWPSNGASGSSPGVVSHTLRWHECWCTLVEPRWLAGPQCVSTDRSTLLVPLVVRYFGNAGVMNQAPGPQSRETRRASWNGCSNTQVARPASSPPMKGTDAFVSPTLKSVALNCECVAA